MTGPEQPGPDLLEESEDPAPLVFRVEGAQRLDAFLAGRLAELGRSRAEVRGWIAEGRVELRPRGSWSGLEEPRLLKPARKLNAGDEVAVWLPPPPLPPGPLEPEDLPVPILHQDEALLVVDKPAGLTVHPGAGQREGTLVNALLHLSPGKLSGVGGPERPGIVHRLDKDTTGVLAVARSDLAHRHLARQFHDRLVSKLYLALVCGPLPRDEGEVDRPLGRHPKDRKRMAVVEGGRPARTRYRVLERFGRFAFVELAPETGRTHQLRVHLRSLGAPILADATYGREEAIRAGALGRARDPDELLLARHALHAARLAFIHPVSGERVTFEAPLPEDMRRTLEVLRAGSQRA